MSNVSTDLVLLIGLNTCVPSQAIALDVAEEKLTALTARLQNQAQHFKTQHADDRLSDWPLMSWREYAVTRLMNTHTVAVHKLRMR